MSEIALGILLLTGLVLALTVMVMLARSVLMPSRPAHVTVNGRTELATTTGTKLLGVLNDAGILVPSACGGAGTCGLCKVRVTEGGSEALPTEAARLSRAELRAGTRLACQITLRGDMGIAVDDDLMGAEAFTCTVASARFLTPLIREIVLEMPPGRRLELTAGSFVQVTAPPFALAFADLEIPQAHAPAWERLRHFSLASEAEVTRAYSVSNRPEDTDAGRLVLNIRLALPPPSVAGAPPGIVSSWLFAVKPGDAVGVSGPYGSFRAQPGEREMVLIGGGVGMAPLRAIIFDQLERRGTSRPISYWYGARSRTELFYAEEFAALAERHPNFRWTVALSDPNPSDPWDGPTGFIHAVVFEQYLRNHPAPESCEYYLCGPPLMIRAVLAMLDGVGVDKESIFNDDFGI